LSFSSYSDLEKVRFKFVIFQVVHTQVTQSATCRNSKTFNGELRRSISEISGRLGFPCGLCRGLVRDLRLIPAKFVPRWLTDEQEQFQFLAAKTELSYRKLLACHFASIVILLVSDNETAGMMASLPGCP